MATIKITGLKAIVFLIMAGGFVAWRAVTARQTLSVDAAEQLQTWLSAEYASRYLRTMDDRSPTAADADALLALQRVTITSIRARGRAPDYVVRAEIAVNGGPPPDGESVRYWRMSFDPLLGWRLRAETHAFSYYSRLF